ncbi:MAG TPA: hypothetical protein VHU89_09460 [Acidobacteriaceae bacterium]|nr:hypothetical protein [Acidobacteriaceae bacterium]
MAVGEERGERFDRFSMYPGRFLLILQGQIGNIAATVLAEASPLGEKWAGPDSGCAASDVWAWPARGARDTKRAKAAGWAAFARGNIAFPPLFLERKYKLYARRLVHELPHCSDFIALTDHCLYREAMTSETKTTVEPEDILAVELECAECHARFSRPLRAYKADPQECPNCHAVWSSQDLGELRDIAYKLATFTETAKRNLMKFRIRFEISHPPRA